MGILHTRCRRNRKRCSLKDLMQKNYKIFHLTGKKGTVHLFDSNAPHKLISKKNSIRINFKTMYTPGNSVRSIRHPNNKNMIIHNLKNLNLNGLNPLQRDIFKYV